MRTIFVGDLHGCAEEFGQILEATGFDRGQDRLLLTGDAFSRGPAPAEVWRLIQENGAEMVLGNHDDRQLKQLRRAAKGKDPRCKFADQQRTLEALLPLAAEILPWLQALPLFLDEPGFLLVHAGINPNAGLEGTTRDEFLAIRTWPPTDGLEGPRWHDAYRPADKPIIFGHDAPGGLVQKHRPDGSLYALGLDSGCIYGGHLSAYLLEEDRLVQIKSRQDPATFL